MINTPYKILYPAALVIVLCTWFIYSGDLYTLYQQHWTEAVTMVLGAFVAGSTPLGGGAVAYPVLSKLLDYSTFDARIFSVMIQSVGMTCASLLFIGLKRKIYWREILAASFISMLVPLFLAELLVFPDNVGKMAFACFELVALSVLLFKLNKLSLKSPSLLAGVLAIFALLGGILTSVIGSGADLMLFIYLIVFKKVKAVEAIPSTVIFMAINALFSVAALLTVSPPAEHIVSAWLAAVPVVAIMAPLGGWVIAYLPARLVLNAIIGLIIIDLMSYYYFISPASNLVLFINFLVIVLLVNKHKKVFLSKIYEAI